MNTKLIRLSLIALLFLTPGSNVFGWGRGGGGFHAGGGGFHYGGGGFGGADRFGGYHEGSFGGARFGDFDRGSFSGSRDLSGWGNRWAGGASGSYDRNYSGAHGGSASVSGTRGAAWGPFGAAAGSTRDVSATGPEGRTYSNESQRGAVRGPLGNTYAGGSRTATASGWAGSATRTSDWRAASTRFPGDFGLAHYSSVAATGVGRTAYWSHGYVGGWANDVRAGFLHYNCFTPAWCTAHPLAWSAAGWGVATAWNAAAWASLALFCGISSPPTDYDYGNTVVYQNNNVMVNGDDVGTTQQYSEQAANLAKEGQQANPPAQDRWESLGVFALVQGDDKTSNMIFQLAVNTGGVIRGNYYDAIMGTTTAVYGEVDKKTQRACWTIGDKKEPVFDCGFYNLTKPETPVLAHFGKDKTEQWLLVRMNEKDSQQSSSTGGQSASGARQPPEPSKAPATATVTVVVPESASVFFDGSATTQTGTQRQFVTPPLQPGRNFYYDIEARWTAQDGTTVDQTRHVLVTAAANIQVNFVK
jgi:uncharacterized protein (TIGR03000 family)